MPDDKIIINIFGPSTAGKSTIAALLQVKFDRLYTVDFDVIKRQINNYHWQRDSKIATQITYDTLKSVSRTNLMMLTLLPPPTIEDHERLEAITRDYNYNLLDIEITAPKDVLIKRYQERLEQSALSGSNCKFKTLDEFKAKLEDGYYRPDDVITFDSSVQSPTEILSVIESTL